MTGLRVGAIGPVERTIRSLLIKLHDGAREFRSPDVDVFQSLLPMTRVSRVVRLPANMDTFISEMAKGINLLYGAQAGAAYLESAREHFVHSVSHPRVLGLAAEPDKGEAGGVLFALRRGRVAQITCVHVLEAYRGRALETALVQEAVPILRSENLDGILCEFVPLAQLDLDSAFKDLGFELAQRELMRAPLHAPGLAALPETSSRVIGPRDVHPVARLIVDAYQGHPGRLLHAEVRDMEGALDFVELALQGGYGATEREFNRCVERNGKTVAAIVACRVAPDTGFVLQVVTDPAWRRMGIGERLLHDCARTLRDAGAKNVALGVTTANPARELYVRMGFETVTPVEARYWWRV